MLLECRSINVGYSGSRVLQDVDFVIEEGEIVTLVGANGAGKSTLVKAISGLLRPTSGEIWFDGKRIDALPTSERLKRGLVHIPEGRQIFAGMTVGENLELGAYVRRKGPSAQRAKQREGVFEQYPFLRERLHEVGGNFSGGQQQMLAIARGLMSEPRLVMLDEPSLGLSPLMVVEVFKLVATLRSRGHAILLSEQNARAALAIADRGYVIENGRVAMHGKASDLLASADIAERYLGVGSATSFSREESAAMGQKLRECIGE